MIESIFLFFLILVGLIVAHELGHFLFAKFFNVKVEEFGIGYPPRIAKMFKIGETEYTINWLPFGGFVRILGEDSSAKISEKDKERAMNNKHPIKQLLILFGGVFVNFILAFLFFVLAFNAGVPHAIESNTGTNKVVITAVLPDSPAKEAGVKPGERILEISYKNITITPTSTEQVINFIQKYAGKKIVIKTSNVYDDNKATEHELFVVQGVLKDNPDKAGVGIAIANLSDRPMSLSESIQKAYNTTISYSVLIVSSIKNIIFSAFKGEKADVLEKISGPVGIVSVIKDSYSYGLGSLYFIIAVISVNLAVLNLLPIPALDGGRMALVIVEWIIKRRLPVGFVQAINAISFMLLIFLMLYVTYKDIIKLLP